ncbi:MAG TPA: hypothetical protein VEF89_33130 [Solirubrobacteraceae bacterium]|nr:hypothetical protein [Solirubrobacteraceae bacterium]
MEPGVKLVGRPLGLVGQPVWFVRATLSLIKLQAPLLQPGGLRTGAPSSDTNPLGDSTLLGGQIASSALLASPSVFLGQSSAPLEHLGRAHKDFKQTPRVNRWTRRHACRSRLRPLPYEPLVEPRLTLIGSALALIRDPLTLIGSPLALVGHPVTFVSATLSLIKLQAPSLQSGGLRTGAQNSLTSPPDDSTALGGLIASPQLLPTLGVFLSHARPPLEHLRRSHQDSGQAH